VSFAVAPWLRVALAVAIYVVVALVASSLMRGSGTAHQDMEGRTSPRVIGIGMVANAVVLLAVILLLVFLDGRNLDALGLAVSGRDAVAVLLSVAVVATLAGGFLTLLHRRGDVRVRWRGLPPRHQLSGLLGVVAVLAVVALQEEALYRGYVSLNLLRFGSATVVVTSTVVFAAIHLLTNRADAAQMASWIVGGFTFVCIYLVSGSLWVAALLHLVVDLTNVVAFGIVGRYAVVDLEPALSTGRRASIRILTSIALVALFLQLYGASVKLG
jgi:membrane protease YdiL (CAAX protease family)